jgi:hypothetical protein
MTAYIDGTIYRQVAPRRWFALRTVGDEELLTAWKAGQDTYQIAVRLSIPEHEVERRLHRARDIERSNPEWNWPPMSPVLVRHEDGSAS